MVVGELRHGQLTIIDRLRETVRLSEGLTDNGELKSSARQRAIDCLERFGERLHDMHASSVRAAGTSALRRARDSREFRAEAENALGHPIEVISGHEEARLIYLGVTHSLPPNDGLRLVLDIGGGSTELILGRGPKPVALESLHMGCVLMTETYFPKGNIERAAFDAARLAARLKLRPVKAYFRDLTDIEAIGTSGTINSTEAVARELGVTKSDGLTIEAVERLIEEVCEFGNVAEIKLAGLSDRRAQVWPGGLAILAELLGVLRVDRLGVSDGALREGLLYDYLGRLKHEDARERSVAAMARRYNVDEVQALRVSDTALDLLSQVRSQWKIEAEFAVNILSWAARLHEIGLDISHDGFQRHGAYIAEHADMPGFPRSEQQFLAYLIANQRRQMDKAAARSLPGVSKKTALRLGAVLRLAVLLNRSRSTQALPKISFHADGETMELRFPAGWLEDNPLTVADLDRERVYLEEIGARLQVH